MAEAKRCYSCESLHMRPRILLERTETSNESKFIIDLNVILVLGYLLESTYVALVSSSGPVGWAVQLRARAPRAGSCFQGCLTQPIRACVLGSLVSALVSEQHSTNSMSTGIA